MTYFKYTNGEAFTLNGEEYKGAFHVNQGNAYTGTLSSDDSEKLTPKNNFISSFYSNKMEFDVGYDNTPQLVSYRPNIFDIVNKQELDKIVGVIDANNVSIFKGSVLKNPNMFDMAENQSHFYGLSSTDLDQRNDDIINGKTVYTHIDPFSGDEEWKFLDDIKTGTFLVDTFDNFKYICSTGTVNYTLSGNFSNTQPLVLVSTNSVSPTDTVFQIYYDDIEKRISFVYKNFIEVYDASNYADCNNLLSLDIISLIDPDTKSINNNENNQIFIKFGKVFRTNLKLDQLQLFGKYSNYIKQTINLKPLKLGEVLSIDIRQEDDLIGILHKTNNRYYVTFINPIDLIDPLLNKTIILQKIDFTAIKHEIKFSNSDSNTFFTSNNKQYHSRFITYPTYPHARLENSDLLYLDKYIFGTTPYRFGSANIKWNSNSMLSNSYNNLLTTSYLKGDTLYVLLHNVGRIYALKSPQSGQYFSSIPINIEKYFTGLLCSESSFGLYFNDSISSLVSDTLNLYNKSAHTFKIGENDIIISDIEQILFEVSNLYLNGNETINIISMRRILELIEQIQSKLLSAKN